MLGDVNLSICPDSVDVDISKQPILTSVDKNWCRWALTEGKAKPGMSWGVLKQSERKKFVDLICAAIPAGVKQSCDSIWGDFSVQFWRSNIKTFNCGLKDKHLRPIDCWTGITASKFCIFQDIILDFNKMSARKNKKKEQERHFEKGFVSTACTYINESTIPLKKYMMDLSPDNRDEFHKKRNECNVYSFFQIRNYIMNRLLSKSDLL